MRKAILDYAEVEFRFKKKFTKLKLMVYDDERHNLIIMP